MEKSYLDIAWVLLCAALVFVMQGGFMCLESGLTRAKNSINVAIKNLTDFGLSAVLFWMVGYGLMFGDSAGGLVGLAGWFHSVGEDGAWLAAFFLFQVMFCATAATIISGAVAERIRFGGYLIVTLLISGLIYPVFGHWAWNGIQHGAPAGWLSALGFVDFAGATVVHSVGGWVALATLVVVGPREGRFPEGAPPRKFTGSNVPMAVLGVMLLWLGWLGFNGGSTFSINGRVAGILANTVLAGSAGAVVTLAVGWRLRRRPDVILVMNGSLAGLVAITACCHAVDSASAVLIGGTAGLVMLAAESFLESRRVDDAVGAVGVHLAAGIWGTLALAVFGEKEILATGLSRLQQFGIQSLGILVCGVWTFGLAYLALRAANRFFPLRVTREQEHLGLNVSEHGATTEFYDLVTVMESQVRTGDLSLRVPVDPFTEVGQFAEMYNHVLDTLEEAREYTGHIVKTTTTLIYRVTPEGTTVFVNPAVTRATGYAARELAGRNWWRILYPGDEFRQVDQLYRELENAPLVNYEMTLTTKAGQKRVILWNIVNRFTHDGRLVELIGIGADVTAQREVERMKEEFLSVVSHELRTPLTSIRGSLGLLAGGLAAGLPEKGQRMLDIAVRNTDRLARLINDILDIERIKSGRVRMERAACDAGELMQQAAEAMLGTAEQAGVRIVIEPLAARVWADPDRMVQTLDNLISNAIKFSPHGATVRLSAEQQGEIVVFQVRDEGRGIPADKLETVFERFQQVEASDFREKGGAGLGLAICRSIVDGLGGRIWVESTPGQGSSFFVALPAAAYEEAKLSHEARRAGKSRPD
jgi:Amt family ammonium transporter